MTEINYNDPVDKQLDTYADSLDVKIPEQRVLKNLLIDAAVQLRVKDWRYNIALTALKEYADPGFWEEEVKPKTQAAKDLGTTARNAVNVLEPL